MQAKKVCTLLCDHLQVDVYYIHEVTYLVETLDVDDLECMCCGKTPWFSFLEISPCGGIGKV
jgi:hypothetical protein